jgi:hypothetical protein
MMELERFPCDYRTATLLQPAAQHQCQQAERPYVQQRPDSLIAGQCKQTLLCLPVCVLNESSSRAAARSGAAVLPHRQLVKMARHTDCHQADMAVSDSPPEFRGTLSGWGGGILVQYRVLAVCAPPQSHAGSNRVPHGPPTQPNAHVPLAPKRVNARCKYEHTPCPMLDACCYHSSHARH